MAFETFRNFFMGSDSDYYYEEEEAPEEQYVQEPAQQATSKAKPANANATRPTATRRPNVLPMDGSRPGETSKIALYIRFFLNENNAYNIIRFHYQNIDSYIL